MKILYIISGETKFKKRDEIILSEIGDLKKINMSRWKDYLDPKNLELLIWCDYIFIWFASFHAIPFILLNQIFKKKVYIVAGGYDVANLQEIKYGSMMFGFRRKIGQWILKHANNVIAVSKSNRDEIIKNCKVHPQRIKLIYNAIRLKNKQSIYHKSNQVLTVGELNEETVLRKGLDRFVNISRAFPNIQFIHIGKWTNKHGKQSKCALNKLKSEALNNVKFLGFVSDEILEKTFQESKVYLQLSRHEAFGLSVLEAMNYGCVPIVANAYALPEVVCGNGYIVKNYKECISAIEDVFKTPKNKKNNINSMFDLSVRKDAFEKLMI